MAKNLKTRGMRKAASGRGPSGPVGTNLGGSPFANGGGGHAMTRFMAAAKALPVGQKWKAFNTAVLRTADTLRHESWKYFDEALISEALIQLKGVADLEESGLVSPVPNSLGKTVFAYEKVTFMDDAQVSMDGMADTDNDRQEFSLNNLPLPMTHKDFFIDLRTLTASQDRGEALDTTQVRTAGRTISEMAEQLLFQGYAGKFGGLSIYGYTTFPDRNTVSFGVGGNWAFTNYVDGGGAKTSQEIVGDAQTLVQKALNDRFYGPYWLYVDRLAALTLESDYIPNATTGQSTKTIRARLMDIEGIVKVQVVDKLPANTVVLVQATMDVVSWVKGEPLQTVQWDEHGGMKLRFKAFQIGVPLIKSDIQGRCGVVHMS